MGARPLRRTIQRELEDTLSEKILCPGLGGLHRRGGPALIRLR